MQWGSRLGCDQGALVPDRVGGSRPRGSGLRRRCVAWCRWSSSP